MRAVLDILKVTFLRTRSIRNARVGDWRLSTEKARTVSKSRKSGSKTSPATGSLLQIHLPTTLDS